MPDNVLPHSICMAWNGRVEKLFLPIMPEKMELKRKGRGQTKDIIGLGQINNILPRELAEISFESFFPSMDRYSLPFNSSSYYPFLSSKTLENIDLFLKEPKEYVTFLASWQDSGYPVRFIYQSPEFLINLPVSIEQFDRWEEAGSEGDIYYRITLKEFVFHAARRVKGNQENGKTVLKKSAPERLDERVPPTTYTVKSGDRLIIIAQKMLGDSGRWKEIQQLNKLSDAQVKSLRVGQVLKLPKRR